MHIDAALIELDLMSGLRPHGAVTGRPAKDSIRTEADRATETPPSTLVPTNAGRSRVARPKSS
ncbi:MAG TPA: hypothetical protein VGD53_21385, partial [Actinoallomurus sp.]